MAALQQIEQQQTEVAANGRSAAGGKKKPRPRLDSGRAAPANTEEVQGPKDSAVKPSEEPAPAPAAAAEPPKPPPPAAEGDGEDAGAEPAVAPAPTPAPEPRREAPVAEEPDTAVEAPVVEAPKEAVAEAPAQEAPEAPAAEQAPGAKRADTEEAVAPPRPRSKLQGAFAALADLTAAEERSPTPAAAPAMDKLTADFMSPPPSADAPGAAAANDDLFSAFIAPAPVAPEPAEEPIVEDSKAEEAEEVLAAAEGGEADPEKEEGDEEEADDDEEAPMVKRRRGEGDMVSFELETSGIEGAISAGLKGVAMRMGGRQVLQDASWVVRTGDRTALVGANGCGKTTQLRILTGELPPDEGSVMKSREDIRMAVLSQGFVDELNLENSVREELLSAVPRESKVLKELAEVERQIEEAGETSDEAMSLVDRLTDLQTQAEELRAYDMEGRMSGIIAKVGFLPDDLDQPVGVFSGGWKVRIGLSKIFMTAPDMLLLDEPTNHLDLESVEWLEVFLTQQALPIVLVSHDREFMDRVCNKVVETIEGMTYTYDGNYTQYIKQRDGKLEAWRKKYALQEKQVKELEAFIKANRGKQLMANTRNKRIMELEKMRASDSWLDPPPTYAKRIKFEFPEPPKQRRGSLRVSTLAQLQDVTHGYGDGSDSLLIEGANFTVRAGEKIGIVGRNGCGKSTLLRLLMGEEKPSVEGGSVMPVDKEKTCFFTQHQADLLPPDLTAFEVVKEANQILMDDDELKEIMKKFRFKGDRLNVQCKYLSGGEKARLAIVRMMLTPSRLLVFDEPTNHLDVPMKETLEYSLREYDGAVVVVSHDRWFLSQTCESIAAIKDRKLEKYDGDFRHYMDRNPEVKRKIESHYAPNSRGISSVPLSRAARKKQERGGLKKNWRKRAADERKEMLASMYGGGGRRRR